MPRRGSRIRHGFSRDDAIDHHALVVERHDVDGEAHPAGVDAPARHDPQRLAGIQPVAGQESDGARGARVRHRDVVGDDRAGIQVPGNQPHVKSRRPQAYFEFSISGNSTVTKRIAAGPMVTTQIAGKMQKTSGNTILTPVLAAASSARWRRFVRSVSE